MYSHWRSAAPVGIMYHNWTKFHLPMQKPRGHVNIGIIFYWIGISQCCRYNTQSKSDWLFNTHTQTRVLQADWIWLLLENNEKATLNINMPYWWISTYFTPLFQLKNFPDFLYLVAASVIDQNFLTLHQTCWYRLIIGRREKQVLYPVKKM